MFERRSVADNVRGIRVRGGQLGWRRNGMAIPTYLIYKDKYDRLNMIGRERENRALIGCDSQ